VCRLWLTFSRKAGSTKSHILVKIRRKNWAIHQNHDSSLVRHHKLIRPRNSTCRLDWMAKIWVYIRRLEVLLQSGELRPWRSPWHGTKWVSLFAQMIQSMKSLWILTLFWHMQTTFNAPGGHDPLALDMGSMGKGIMWINGQSIGRHWPANLAKGKCSHCHYAGQYSETKCLSDCEKPSQRWSDQCSHLATLSFI